MVMDYSKAAGLISNAEHNLFTGPFSETFIIKDLETRKTADTPGEYAGTTDKLDEKKRFYIQYYSEWQSSLDAVLEWLRTNQPWDSSLISSCETCKDQVTSLFELVRRF